MSIHFQTFQRIYMPVQMEMLLKEYMSYEKALNTIAESHYDILSLEDNICYSQVRFSDGYAVYAKDCKRQTTLTLILLSFYYLNLKPIPIFGFNMRSCVSPDFDFPFTDVVPIKSYAISAPIVK